MQFVAGGEDKRDWASPRETVQFIDLGGVVPEFLSVSATKLAPAGRIMSEPTPKLGARCYVLQPAMNAGIGLLHPARPEPVNENANAIIGGRELVGSFQSDVFSRDPAHRRLLLLGDNYLL